MTLNPFLAPFEEKSADGDQRDVLQDIPLFKELSVPQLSAISDLLYERQYESEETVFSSGDPATALYIGVSGEIEIIMENDRGDHNELTRLGHGEFFGERALCKELERTATAKTTEESILLVLFRQELMELINRKKGLGIVVLSNLVEVLGDRLQWANNTIQSLITDGSKFEEAPDG